MRKMAATCAAVTMLVLTAGLAAGFEMETQTPWGASERDESAWGVPDVQKGKMPPLRPNLTWNRERFIRDIYQGFLNRRPSPLEIGYWQKRLDQGYNRAEIVRDFMNSDEYFVRQSYLGLLHREPDPGGMKHFMDLLRSGGNRMKVVQAMLISPEFHDRIR
jgi:hypothetical protein